MVQINAGIFHDPAATNAIDGGLTIKSSVPGGILILNPTATNANTAAGVRSLQTHLLDRSISCPERLRRKILVPWPVHLC